jgi:hypothetical protein
MQYYNTSHSSNTNSSDLLRADQLKKADICKSPAVLTEFSAFLNLGAAGVPDLRQHITTTRGNFTSDELSNTLFNGVKVKAEVLN